MEKILWTALWAIVVLATEIGKWWLAAQVIKLWSK